MTSTTPVSTLARRIPLSPKTNQRRLTPSSLSFASASASAPGRSENRQGYNVDAENDDDDSAPGVVKNLRLLAFKFKG
jgi:hypothetical protein